VTETPETPDFPQEASEEEAAATPEGAEAAAEDSPVAAPEAEAAAEDSPVAAPEAEAAGGAAEASKVDLEDERPAPPVRAREPEPGAPPAPEAQPIGHGPPDPGAPPASDEELEVEATPRVRPEIPGADLVPDIVPEGEEAIGERSEYEEDLDEAPTEAEEAEEELRIAEAAIDLAAGARYPSRGYVVGKRKSSVARVYLRPGSGAFTISCPEAKRSDRSLQDYFPRTTLQRTIRQPLEAVGYQARMDVVARIHGGGVSSQADALRHAITRALLEADPNLRGELKRRGFLTRDDRAKERKKAGLKKARKRPQFSKR
jgi:small subunit ribosomal protein S9